jgi:DNA-binding NtrC family response regulator
VEFDPSTVPASLFESELFGSAAGAFSGSPTARLGRVGRAEGGTFVLDRIEEIPLGSQPKLLRLLSECAYAPLGGPERVIGLRFVAIAAPDLLERVEQGAVRRDLFHRLEVLAFRVPSLRERRAELGGIATAILADLAERLGRPGLFLDPNSLPWICSHPWPGNLRQLRNVLERAALVAQDLRVSPTPSTTPGRPPTRLDELEADAIRAALAFARGQQTKAAAILGISRKSLWERRRKFGIP